MILFVYSEVTDKTPYENALPIGKRMNKPYTHNARTYAHSPTLHLLDEKSSHSLSYTHHCLFRLYAFLFNTLSFVSILISAFNIKTGLTVAMSVFLSVTKNTSSEKLKK